MRAFAVLFSLCWHFVCTVWHLCDLPCGVIALFSLISIAKCVLKSLSVVFQFEGQIFREMFQREVDNWKPQAGDHVTSLCRRSISGRNDILLSLPTGVLSLPVAALFLFIYLFIYFHALFFAAPWLTERLEEASWRVTLYMYETVNNNSIRLWSSAS